MAGTYFQPRHQSPDSEDTDTLTVECDSTEVNNHRQFGEFLQNGMAWHYHSAWGAYRGWVLCSRAPQQ